MALLASVVKGFKGSKYMTTDEGKRLLVSDGLEVQVSYIGGSKLFDYWPEALEFAKKKAKEGGKKKTVTIFDRNKSFYVNPDGSVTKDAKTPEEYKEAFEKRLQEIKKEMSALESKGKVETLTLEHKSLHNEKKDLEKTLSEIKAGTWWGGKIGDGIFGKQYEKSTEWKRDALSKGYTVELQKRGNERTLVAFDKKNINKGYFSYGNGIGVLDEQTPKIGDTVAYRGYLITSLSNGKFRIDKGGFCIQHETPTFESAKKIIDELV
jgi:hypothetical protein